MMTSSRPRGDVGGSFASRRGHASQLSISDPSHHVTEAIGTLYGDEDDSGSEAGRPLSFIGGGGYQEHLPRPPMEDRLAPDSRRTITRSTTEPLDSMTKNGGHKTAQAYPKRSSSQRNSTAYDNSKSPLSPTLSLRDVQSDSSNSHFPLTNIDNPNDIAQELSNLQALRRLSMDVGNNKDPDMPPMSLMAMPAIAPTGDDDENDPSRLLWVPARVHPELAPTEFKSFLEKRVHTIRRRSGDSFLSVDDDSSQSGSEPGGLRRKKSMLSRQIDTSGGRGGVDYVDGADRLEMQRSRGNSYSHEFSLDELVRDPTGAVQKLAQESSGPEGSTEDMPILPAVPGMGLRRSTRTTYRKGGSLRSGERPVFRRTARYQDSETAESGSSSHSETPKGHSVSRIQTEMVGSDNYSRPNRTVRRQHKFSQESLGGFDPHEGTGQDSQEGGTAPTAETSFQEPLPVRTSSNATVPIIETTTPEEPIDMQDEHGSRSFPQRSSSQNPESEPAVDEPPPRSNRRNTNTNRQPPQVSPQQAPPQQQTSSRSSYPQGQSVNENLAANPAPLPGGGATRTDNLTFIPTAPTEEKKTDKKSKKDKDDDTSSISSRSWKWFRKDDDSKKSKSKTVPERSQDNARLDVIQNSIDKNSPKGRESLILERESMDNKLQEERKRENHRKSDSKKEKDGSIFSSIFGGGKKKEEKEKHAKKTHHLKVPEEPVYKPLAPDVDYHWSRFPLLEERAIYRMAHIKLANPRRSLLSQVLLSNFMYSYLAIVQAMHPQMNVPTSPQQKRLEEEARRKQEQEYLAQQQMQAEQESQDAMDNYNFEYSRGAVQYADAGGNDEVEYVDDAQIYEDEHGNDPHDGYGYDSSDAYGQGAKEYYQYHDTGNERRDDGRDDMW